MTIDDHRRLKREEARNAAVEQLQREAEAMRSALGDSGSTGCAPDNIMEGELFMAGGGAYVALRNIPRGASLTEGTNVRKTTVARYLTEISKED